MNKQVLSIVLIAMFLTAISSIIGCAKKDAAPVPEEIPEEDTLMEDDESADTVEESNTQPQDAQPITGDTDVDYEGCDYLSAKQIEDTIGNVYFKVKVSPMEPAGCSLLWQSREVRYKFFYAIRDFQGSESTAMSTIGRYCKDLDNQPDEYKSQLGDLSCRREATVISYERDIFFVKGDKVVQVGADTAQISFDDLVTAAELIEKQI